MDEAPSLVMNVMWQPLFMDGLVRINFDGAMKGANGLAGSGGVLRDANGQWIYRYSKSLGSYADYVAGLWRLLDGLLIAKARGYHKIELHVDSSVVCNQLTRVDLVSPLGEALVDHIRALLREDWVVCITHCYLDVNFLCG